MRQLPFWFCADPDLVCAFFEPWMGAHPLCEAEAERGCRQFDADVAVGKYDADGWTRAERTAQAKRRHAA